MAMAVGGSEGVKSDINITPLVDVVLVLLIIFMVVTPLLQKGFDMDIPRTAEAETRVSSSSQTQLVLTVQADTTMYLNKTEVDRRNLGDEVSKAITGRKDKVIFVQADSDLDYAYVVKLMDECRQAGVETVALITQENFDIEAGSE